MPSSWCACNICILVTIVTVKIGTDSVVQNFQTSFVC